MKHKTIIIISIVTLFSIFSCKPKHHKSKYGCVPSEFVENPFTAMSFGFDSNAVYFQLMNLDAKKDSMPIGHLNNFLYYLNASTKVYDNYAGIDIVDGKYIVVSGDAFFLSYSSNQKQFYVDWPNGKTDSLFIDYKKDDSKDNSCCCQYPLQSLTLNSKSFIRKTNLDKNGVYIFER